MKHFLDLGTHRFDGLRMFIEKLNIDNSWCVWCFEANKLICERNQPSISHWSSKFHQFQLFAKAVTDYNGTVVFNRHKGAWGADKQNYNTEYDTGSNILEENPSRDAHNAGVYFDVVKDEVDCIDVNDILQNIINTDKDAEIYIKCDIEGSEFKVMPRILKSPHLKHIKEMYIEWHERFFYDPNKYREMVQLKSKLIEEFTGLGILCSFHG